MIDPEPNIIKKYTSPRVFKKVLSKVTRVFKSTIASTKSLGSKESSQASIESDEFDELKHAFLVARDSDTSESTLVCKQSTESLTRHTSKCASVPCLSKKSSGTSSPTSSSLGHRATSSNVSFNLTKIEEDESHYALAQLASKTTPLAVQPEDIEMEYRAKRTKSERSRQSLKSVPSLADLRDEQNNLNQLQSMPQLSYKAPSRSSSKRSTRLWKSVDLSSEATSSDETHSPAHRRQSIFRRKPTKPRQKEQSLQLYKLIQDLLSKSKESCQTSSTPRKSLSLRYKKRPSTAKPLICTDESSSSRSRSRSVDIVHESSRAFQTTLKETSVIYVKTDDSQTLMSPLGTLEATRGQVNQYHLLNEIGSGSFGHVYLCRHDGTGQYYACKVISKNRLSKKMRWLSIMPQQQEKSDLNEKIRREIAVLKKLSRHPNINFMAEVLDDADEDDIYMIFELCEYGPIMQLQAGETVTPYSEDMARGILRDVLLGLEFLHYKKIIHRDIKPENLLFGSDFVVEIADFGISHAFENEDDPFVEDKNASPMFSPPEALKADSKILDGKAADVWSLGITLYCLVHGRAPFEDEDIVQLSNRIIEEEIVCQDEQSALLQDLLSLMLRKSPRERITIPEIKVHPWVTCRGRQPMLSTEENCVYEEPTAEEVEQAFQPVVTFASKIMDTFKRMSYPRRHSGDLDAESTNDSNVSSFVDGRM